MKKELLDLLWKLFSKKKCVTLQDYDKAFLKKKGYHPSNKEFLILRSIIQDNNKIILDYIVEEGRTFLIFKVD